ncbi:methyltransferase domain-containing protein [Plantactinospora sp. B5E13]|uniref:class I SAM-dependent methyltransferase n=1 Tax=unclassified Plantactinospora TaxID=2631981 RepID=UPI00325EE8BE
MTVDATSFPDRPDLTDAQRRRWTQVLDRIVEVLPAGAVAVVVDSGASPVADDGPAPAAANGPSPASLVADRLAEVLRAVGRPCVRLTDGAPLADEDRWRAERTAHTVALADGPRWRRHPPGRHWDVVVRLRIPADRGGGDRGRDGRGAVPPASAGDRSRDGDIVVDLHEANWPVIRHIADRLAPGESWHLRESQAFFAVRAPRWDSRFGGDLPVYAQAVADTDLPTGGTVVDVGCGTGRALPALRDAVGPDGTVVGLDVTPEMLAVARAPAARANATLLLADARHLPFPDARVDAVLAAGLLTHLPDSDVGLRELARITRPGGRLVLFHPSGRAALAARHGRRLRPDEPLAETPLREATARTGWRLDRYDDAPHRFLAIAVRMPAVAG